MKGHREGTMIASKPLVGVSGLLMLVALGTTGCATKKYVRQQTTPIQQRVEDIDKKHTQAVAQLEGKEQKDVSRVEERAMSAENKANDAARAAQAADQRAGQAADAARNATELAQSTQSKVSDLTNAVTNIDNYRMISSEDVLFGFDKATLTSQGKQKLDQLVSQTQGMGRYILEVEGFTDRTGPRDYNLALSRRRADAVVRYLVDKGVPLRRIHMLGLGSEQPRTDENVTASAQGNMQGQTGMQAGQTGTQASTTGTTGRLTRKEQRRVIVRVWAPETTLSASTGTTTTGTSTGQTQQPK
jgi:outer membrane protein OmpA-like peptidoglycan-associated protein